MNVSASHVSDIDSQERRNAAEMQRKFPHRERIGSCIFSCAHVRKCFRSVLLIPPIGLTSAEKPRSKLGPKKTPILTRRTIVFSQVPTQAALASAHRNNETTTHIDPRRANERVQRAPFVYVRAPQHEQPASAPTNPRQELRKEVRNHHAQARLDILQRKVLRVASTVHAETRSLARHDLEERPERRHDIVHVQVRVVTEVPRQVDHPR